MCYYISMEAPKFTFSTREFAETFTTVKGRPFSLARRPWWAYLYDLYYYDIIIMGGRQIEKSTFIRNKLLAQAIGLHNRSLIYGSATYRHVKRFYRDHWVPNLYGNPLLRKYTTASFCINNQNMTYLANRTSVDFVTLRGNGDSVRGIAGDRLFLDEIQDITYEAVGVARQCLSHAGEVDEKNGQLDDIGMIVAAGTPKTDDNILSQTYWNKSTAEEWVVKCQSCGKYNILGLANIHPEGIICANCYRTRKAVVKLNTLTGQWVARYKLSDTRPKRGFRIPQMLLAALFTPHRYQQKFYIEVRNADPLTLHNEILALPYGLAEKPLTMNDFSKGDYRIVPWDKLIPTYRAQRYLVGIDWGDGSKSYTVMVIGYPLNDGTLKIVYLKRFERGAELDKEYQLSEIIKIIKYLKPHAIGVDWGMGYAHQNPKLQRIFGRDRVFEIYNSGVQTALIKKDRKKNYFTINRDDMLSDTFQEIRDGNIIFPADSDSFIQDFLNIKVEYRTDKHGDREPYYTHDETHPDDSAHALNYLRVAGKIIGYL